MKDMSPFCPIRSISSEFARPAPPLRRESAPARTCLQWEGLFTQKDSTCCLKRSPLCAMPFPGADLIIAGSGPEEATLKLLCRSLCLESAVSFAGHVDPVFAFFPGTTLFVLSSRYEGMPNALLEAAAAGLPLVATPASGGIVDLLCGQPGAWLATEISAKSLAATIVTALSAIRPGERFHHQFFPSAAGLSRTINHEA